MASRALLELPIDLEASARACGALRRKRKLRSGLELARLALSYACSDLSLRSLSPMAGIRTEGVYRRLLGCERWLGELLASALPSDAPTPGQAELRLLIADATVVCGPGAKGTQWRVHALYDPRRGELTGVELTDEHGAESLGRLCAGEGCLLLGDRGLGHARSYLAARAQGAEALCRIEPRSVRLLDGSGSRFDVVGWERSLGREPQERTLVMPGPQGEKEPVRVVGQRTLEGTSVVLATSLGKERASAEELLALYRARWQVELQFKRLKGLLGLGDLPCKPGRMARCWILARLLACALSQRSLRNPTSREGGVLGASGGRSRRRSGALGAGFSRTPAEC